MTKDRELAESIRGVTSRPAAAEASELFFEMLTRAAWSQDARTRTDSAYPLGWYMADPDGRATGLIRGLLADEDDLVRLVTAKTVARRGSPVFQAEVAGQVVPILVAAAEQEQGFSRTKLLTALGRFPTQAPTLLPTLLAALDAADPWERYAASAALGHLGLAAYPAAEALRRAIEREMDSWTSDLGPMDLRRIHAATLFRIIGDNPWSRAMLAERLAMPDLPTKFRTGALRLQRQMDGLEPPRRE